MPGIFRWLRLPRADLPFDAEDANRFLPWIIGIMTVLTALALSAGLTLSSVMVAQIRDFDQRYQIHIPSSGGAEKDIAAAIAANLPKQQGISKLHVMTDQEVADLLGPWLGPNTQLDLLPIPRIIDVWIKGEEIDAQAAQDALSALASQYPGIQVEHFAAWVDKFNATARNIQRVIYGIALLMLSATVTVIILVTKASVRLHFDIVKLLHRIGARDHYISRQFQWNAMWLTLKGAVPGTLIAAGITMGCFYFLNRLDALSPISAHSGAFLALYLLLPGFLTLCVSFSTYLTVRHTLASIH